jgi:hypothetical protein
VAHQPGFGSSFGSAGLHQTRGSGRVRKTFAQLAKAKLEAETVANRICAGELNVLTLTSEDRTSYVRSLEMLKPSGTPLEIAVMQFVETAKLLDGASLLEAAKFYLRHNPRHREYGKVVPVEQMSGKLRKLARKKGVDLKWKHNALRHSFISYRVAETQNVAQTALEAGNNPKIIFSNYRELVKPADAVKWFSVEPETPANVIRVPTAAVA